jgi:acyl carrier protein
MTDWPTELVALIVDEVGVHDGEPVDAETDLLLTGIVDSLGVVQIVGWLEDRLGISIDPGDVTLENFQTVGRMVRYVTDRHGVNAGR